MVITRMYLRVRRGVHRKMVITRMYLRIFDLK